MKRLIAIFLTLSLIILTLPTSSLAAANALLWGTGSKLSIPNSQMGAGLGIQPDGKGGAVFVWSEYGSATEKGIRAQRVDKNGKNLWGQYGILVDQNTGSNIWASLIADGKGNYIIATNRNHNNLFFQKINNAGKKLWGSGTVIDVSTPQTFPQIAPDGKGGAIITWFSQSPDRNIYANALATNGSVRFSTNKVICDAAENQESPKITSDNNSGAYITWEDKRRGSTAKDAYLQHISYSLNPHWQANGILAAQSQQPNESPYVLIQADNKNRVNAAWHILELDDKTHIYGQKFSAKDGSRLWSTDAQIGQGFDSGGIAPNLIVQKDSGLMVFYETIMDYDPYINYQRISSSGQSIFPGAYGKSLVPPDLKSLGGTYATSDEVGNALVSWDQMSSAVYNLAVQKVRPNGQKAWGDNMVVANGSMGYQSGTATIAADGYGAAIIVYGVVSNSYIPVGIYVQKIGNNDKSKPILKGVNVKRKQVIRRNYQIKVKAKDKQSGIYRVDYRIDGKLKATVYKSLKYTLKKKGLKRGKHTLKVTVFNGAGLGRSIYRTIYIAS